MTTDDKIQVPAWVAEELFETENSVLDEDNDLHYGFAAIQDGDAGRWNQHHQLVFTFDGRHWAIDYELGLTENQPHEFPWARDMWSGNPPNFVEAYRVYPHEMTTIEYRRSLPH